MRFRLHHPLPDEFPALVLAFLYKFQSVAIGKGLETIRSHCEDFIRTRLAPANPSNDGKQTPMRGHPVFKAQHACACCCRDCLAKWE
ncbi:MAG: DUF4186 family protein, partial [Kiritimatiellae bacterium]|nr:DUF4186 family protein [Kiritimatiellia bacterium]